MSEERFGEHAGLQQPVGGPPATATGLMVLSSPGRRRLARVGALLLYALAVAGVAAGDPAAGSSGDLPPIRSAAEIDYPPFSVVGADGRADGFAIELLRATLAAVGRDVTFRVGPWPEVRSWLERGGVGGAAAGGSNARAGATVRLHLSLHDPPRRDRGAAGHDRHLHAGRSEGARGRGHAGRQRRGVPAPRAVRNHYRTTFTFEDALRELAEAGTTQS